MDDLLDYIMGVEEAGTLWGLSPDHVKRLCQDGKVECKKIGKTWVLTKGQPNPKQRNRQRGPDEWDPGFCFGHKSKWQWLQESYKSIVTLIDYRL